MQVQENCIPLSLDHQSILTGLWQPMCMKCDLQYAEYSFANAYIFRRKHSYRFLEADPPLVQGQFKPNSYYLIPTSLTGQLNLELLRTKEESSTCYFPIPEQWLKAYNDNRLTVISCRGESDYLFKTAKLKTMKGRELSSRRNLIHQLEAEYTVESKPITQKELPDARAILDLWQEQSTEPKDKTDYFACLDAFEHFQRLELFGRIVYANGAPIGFTLGGLLTPKTALLHISKGRHEFKGVTPFLYRDFALHLPESVLWINLEEDLGLPGLRQAKEAYFPDKLLSKWRICMSIP